MLLWTFVGVAIAADKFMVRILIRIVLVMSLISCSPRLRLNLDLLVCSSRLQVGIETITSQERTVQMTINGQLRPVNVVIWNATVRKNAPWTCTFATAKT